jgi:hypothetical protein
MTTLDTQIKPVINVCLLQPAGYLHAMALLEAAEYVAEKARLAGYESVLSKNRLFQHGLNIVFGAHINPKDNPDFPPNTVIFNTEQIPEKSVWISSQYKACLDRHFVWDYSDSNLKMIGHQKTGLIDFYHVDMLQRIAPTQQTEYDLVFYGSMNERRKLIIDRLRNKGLKILTVFGLYGYERDCLLGKARAVLNLHFYESQIFQQIRAFYALSNGMPVVSENYPEASAPPLYKTVLFTPGTRQFEDFAAELLSHDEPFRIESKARLERFYASRGNTDFNQVLEKTIRAVTEENSAIPSAKTIAPSRINLLGRHYLQGHLNIGTDPSTNPDAMLDLSLPLKLPATLSSKTWGTTTLSENQLDEIVAVDALARVQQLAQLMDNCLKLLREGGKLTITVPYELSLGAWQDPSHIRAFNENSWLQYTQWFWRLGWLNYRFDLTESSMNLTDFGKTMVAKNVAQDEILRTPRAIESMRVVLTKRKTSPEERMLACAHSSGFMPGATG